MATEKEENVPSAQWKEFIIVDVETALDLVVVRGSYYKFYYHLYNFYYNVLRETERESRRSNSRSSSDG